MADVAAPAQGVCCVCGVSMVANRINTCAQCLQTNHDVTADLAKNGVLMKCKGCERYQKPQTGWIYCAPESKGLLALCLKKIKGLSKVHLVDASFIWTEEHSKRIKVKLVVQDEIARQVKLQQACVVEFVVQNKMCEDCHMQEASVTWNSVVQLRQKVEHKRTFLYLEQLILKHQLDSRTVRVEPMPDGVDFYFAARNDAVRFLDFVETVVPVRYKTSKKIISQDLKSNIAIHNFTYSTEIVPICRDDAICLPRSMAQKLGSISQFVLCQAVTNVMRFIDPVSCQVAELSGERYFQQPFRAVLSSQRLVPFVVLDVQLQEMPALKEDEEEENDGDDEDEADAQAKVGGKRRRRQKGRGKKKTRGTGKLANSLLSVSGANLSASHRIALVEVAREDDFGVNDNRFFVYTHLGYLLKPGDMALGYDMRTVNLNDEITDELADKDGIPDIVLVRKHYPKWRKNAAKRRKWKLKSMVLDGKGDAGFGVVSTVENHAALERDREMFMRDIEEDAEFRAKMNIYKDDRPAKDRATTDKLDDDDDDDDIEDDAPIIGVESMLDEMKLSAPTSKDDDAESL
ncbi:60S ribosomal export protein NMD3 [Hondaea fermentalgiana]|uniref:60S ribosomal export protein NMD3 n=1 Tax=Hondaea fermentalgiana TaxID=2315210 RepID=A0A2R5GSG0_9STRA|nr:60S ribosomal export protein NMD3 [Hondaea fermentalgiana]|eukprot:GBG33802.1 60S ribosomal export protein NMD3 [Hondaea fermentalgiana]